MGKIYGRFTWDSIAVSVGLSSLSSLPCVPRSVAHILPAVVMLRLLLPPKEKEPAGAKAIILKLACRSSRRLKIF
jgi:hypothetical protein